jgi:trehalose synthase
MAIMRVPVPRLHPARLERVLTSEQRADLERTIERGRALFAGRVLWNLSSTAYGGGVAEMLHSLLAYVRGADIDARWGVIGGSPDFFRVTKRLHNRLHGMRGDGGGLGPAEREVFERGSEENAREVVELIRPGDVVLCHDPQPAGLVPPLARAGAIVVWRCHIGVDEPNDLAREAWDFLRPYVSEAAGYVFSRSAYVWEGLDAARAVVIAPSIDTFSPKNQPMAFSAVAAILRAIGMGDGAPGGRPVFEREDGSPARVDRRASLLEEVTLDLLQPTMLQVSRWDRLKDHAGVIEAFDCCIAHEAPDVHLVLAGPETTGVADDPEGAEVYEALCARWEALDPQVRRRVHVASLPMADASENAAMVNALQRRADVVVQKSLAEGFGLTVSEAMWKGRPVVASAVGGINDQVVEEDTGLLVDPTDLAAFGAAVCRLFADPGAATRMGDRAQLRVRERFLGPRHLGQYVDALEPLIAEAQARAASPAAR